MHTIFPGYYRPTSEQLQVLWAECIFILDTNVLLDLYRYPKQTRDELLGLLKKIADRMWLPYQVALEYQENRLTVVAEQVKRYDEVKTTLTDFQNKLSNDLGKLQLKKRHSSIDPEKLLSNINDQIKQFLTEVQNLQREQPDIQDEDKLREHLDSLFEGKVGPKPQSQSDLDKIYEEGRLRYERLQPPGYMDRGKEKSDKQRDEKDFYFHKGLIIKKEFGFFRLCRERPYI